MTSFFIRKRSVLGCRPSCSAALPAPLMRQLHFWSTCLDVLPFDAVQRRPVGRRRLRRADLQAFVQDQRVAGRADHRALDDVLQLADVAGPVEPLQAAP